MSYITKMRQQIFSLFFSILFWYRYELDQGVHGDSMETVCINHSKYMTTICPAHSQGENEEMHGGRALFTSLVIGLAWMDTNCSDPETWTCNKTLTGANGGLGKTKMYRRCSGEKACCLNESVYPMYNSSSCSNHQGSTYLQVNYFCVPDANITDIKTEIEMENINSVYLADFSKNETINSTCVITGQEIELTAVDITVLPVDNECMDTPYKQEVKYKQDGSEELEQYKFKASDVDHYANIKLVTGLQEIWLVNYHLGSPESSNSMKKNIWWKVESNCSFKVSCGPNITPTGMANETKANGTGRMDGDLREADKESFPDSSIKVSCGQNITPTGMANETKAKGTEIMHGYLHEADKQMFPVALVAGVASGGGFLVLLALVIFVIVMSRRCRSRKHEDFQTKKKESSAEIGDLIEYNRCSSTDLNVDQPRTDMKCTQPFTNHQTVNAPVPETVCKTVNDLQNEATPVDRAQGESGGKGLDMKRQIYDRSVSAEYDELKKISIEENKKQPVYNEDETYNVLYSLQQPSGNFSSNIGDYGVTSDGELVKDMVNKSMHGNVAISPPEIPQGMTREESDPWALGQNPPTLETENKNSANGEHRNNTGKTSSLKAASNKPLAPKKPQMLQKSSHGGHPGSTYSEVGEISRTTTRSSEREMEWSENTVYASVDNDVEKPTESRDQLTRPSQGQVIEVSRPHPAVQYTDNDMYQSF